PSFLSLAANLLSLVRHHDLLIAINTSDPGPSARRSPCSQSLANTISADTDSVLSRARLRSLRARYGGLTVGLSKGKPYGTTCTSIRRSRTFRSFAMPSAYFKAALVSGGALCGMTI